MKNKITLLIPMAFLLLSNALQAQEKLQCLIISEILTPTVIDDQNLSLKMRDGRTLNLGLKRACPQLSFHNSFSYQALRGEICINRDGITTRAGETCTISSITEVNN